MNSVVQQMLFDQLDILLTLLECDVNVLRFSLVFTAIIFLTEGFLGGVSSITYHHLKLTNQLVGVRCDFLAICPTFTVSCVI